MKLQYAGASEVQSEQLLICFIPKALGVDFLDFLNSWPNPDGLFYFPRVRINNESDIMVFGFRQRPWYSGDTAGQQIDKALKSFSELKHVEYIPTPNDQLLNAKLDSSLNYSELFEKIRFKLTEDDIGKIFYTNPGGNEWKIVSNDEFSGMNPDNVGGWFRIGQLDVSDVFST